jgi:hypothetical protein
MSVRMIRSVLAALAIATVAFMGSPVEAQQVGNAYILFNYKTGEIRMNPGAAVAGSNGIISYGVEMDPAIGTLSTNVNDYYFPSGCWSLFPPQTGANPGNAFGSGPQTFSLPNVTGGGGSLNLTHLVIGSPWVLPPQSSPFPQPPFGGCSGPAIPGTTAVYASTIPGYVGTPEFSFGLIGPTNLTQAGALASLGATTEGGFATGNRVYSIQNVTGTQFFRIYTVPEPSTLGLACAGIATLGASAWRKRKLAAKAKA